MCIQYTASSQAWSCVVTLWPDKPSPSLHSHGRLPCPTRVGTCWGVWCGEIPVPDPWSARACHQLGKRQPPGGHQGREVGPKHIAAWFLLEMAAFHRSFSRSHRICFLLSYIFFFLSLVGTLFCLQVFCRLQECVTRTVESSAVWLITALEWNTAQRQSSLFQVVIFHESYICILWANFFFSRKRGCIPSPKSNSALNLCCTLVFCSLPSPLRYNHCIVLSLSTRHIPEIFQSYCSSSWSRRYSISS